MTIKSKKHIKIECLAFELRADSNEIQLTPVGKFKARDGRPACGHWLIDEDIAKKVIARLSQRKTKIAIDYEHQTLYTRENGQPAPAAGWWIGKNTRFDPATGLLAFDIDWTDEARKLIQERKYLYISPVIIYDANTGEVIDIYNAALTNDPAIDGMNEVTTAAASMIFDSLNYGDTPMNKEMLALLRQLLGLPDTATEADIMQALQKISGEATKEDAASNIINALAQKDGKIAELSAKITTLEKQPSNTPDPAKYVPVSAVDALSAELKSLKANVQKDKTGELIQDALKSGKLLPALESWAQDLGAKDFDALKAFLDKAPEIAALKGTQTNGKEPTGNNHGLTAEELEAAALTGMTPEDFAKIKEESK